MKKTSVIYYLGGHPHMRLMAPLKKQEHLKQTIILSSLGRGKFRNHLDGMFFYDTNKQVQNFIKQQNPDVLVLTSADRKTVAMAKKNNIKMTRLQGKKDIYNKSALRVSINLKLLGIAFTIFTFIIAINRGILQENMLLSIQLYSSGP